VAICARNAERVAAAAAELGAQGIVANLSVPGASAEVVGETEKRLGQLDILVVNTGGPPPGLFVELKDRAWRESFEGLWMSTVGAIQSALPGMRARGWGRIIVITSIAAREPVPKLMLSTGVNSWVRNNQVPLRVRSFWN